NPTAVSLDSSGNVYIADTGNNRIRKANVSGTISTVAGQVTFSGDGGPAANASLYFPTGVAFDGNGNLHIVDQYSGRIRAVTPAGMISTVAGNAVGPDTGDGGPATSASLYYPYDAAFDSGGSIYVPEASGNAVRKVTPAGTISTVAGTPFGSGFFGDGGPATSAKFADPIGVALDSAGNLYIADSFNQRVRKVDLGGTISTFAGNGV